MYYAGERIMYYSGEEIVLMIKRIVLISHNCSNNNC